MRFKNTLILAIVMLGLLAYVVGVEFIWKEKSEKAKKEEQKLFHFEEDGVKKITITKGSEEIVLEKVSADLWRITKPLNYDADAGTVKSLITTIHNMEVKKEIPVDDPSPVLYGFDNPQGSIKIETELNSFSFRVGKKSPVSYQLYVMREGEKKVILTEAGLDNHLRKTVTDFRERKVLRFKREDVQSISFRTKNDYTVVEKRGENWYINIPLNVKASNEEMNRILSTLDGLRVDTFVDDSPKNLNQYGLNSPQFTMVMTLKEKGLIELRIGREEKEKKGVYAMVSGSPSVYLVRRSILDDIAKNSNDLREKRIAQIDVAMVNKFEVHKGDSIITFEKTESDEWKVNGEKAKKYEVESLLRKIRDTKAKTFLKADEKSKKDTGLDKPSMRINVYIKDGNTIDIEFGKTKDKDIFVMGTDKDWIVTVERELFDSLNKDASEFKEQETNKSSEVKK
jgi:hypothetical protein